MKRDEAIDEIKLLAVLYRDADEKSKPYLALVEALRCMKLTQQRERSVKLPFKPNMHERYWLPNLYTTEFDDCADRDRWGDCVFDYAMLKLGWVFRTEEECEKALPGIKKEIDKMKEEMK